MHAEQCALCHRTGCKPITMMSGKPALSSGVAHVGIDAQGNQEIAIQEPGHLGSNTRSSSAASMCSTSRAVINRLPAEVGKLEAVLFRSGSCAADDRPSPPRRTNRLIASAIEMRSLWANARATV